MNKGYYLLFGLILLNACKVSHLNNHQFNEIVLEEPRIAERPHYQESASRLNDLEHIQLNLSFDWENRELDGEAYLDFTPYFYPQNTLVIDAKSFDIHELAIVSADGQKIPLDYKYDNQQITIALDRKYTRDQAYQIYLDYTAKPYEITAQGSAAISGARGLYFINHDKTQNKPQQIWTQGAPESNSAWFPCIDKPNERSTQEIAITVNDTFETLSNGLLISSVKNEDGTRTDVWKQSIEHAPYLTMMAIGDFHKTEDSWRDLDVDYYVEHDQAIHAQRIFGKTPQMMEFYSQLLNYDYPWEKYAQVIVRDFVSGAMENTSAVIHGEFVYSDEREFIDDPNEMIIAHELFHHWFGDWVTCESWPNVPLNEAFATYGEYLWVEGVYSLDERQHYLHKEMLQYLRESRTKQEDFIRFDNEDPGLMFDSHSYAKGSRILHMLRYAIGDLAFFEGLQSYLTNYANQAVEVHHLRLAMEHVSGQDLNWFFNQWFLASGHPLIKVEQNIEETTVRLIISQNQSLETTPLYKLPVAVDIYINGKGQRHLIELHKQEQEFVFKTSSKADLVIFDPDHYLLAEVEYPKSTDQFLFQLNPDLHYYDRQEALDSLIVHSDDRIRSQAIETALHDPFWAVKVRALEAYNNIHPSKKASINSEILKLVKEHPKSDVRAAAINCISQHFEGDFGKTYITAIADRSYVVAGAALTALAQENMTTAYHIAQDQLESAHKELKDAVLYTIAKQANSFDAVLIQKEFLYAKDREVAARTNNLLAFMRKQKAPIYTKAIDAMKLKIQQCKPWYVRVRAYRVIQGYIQSSESEFAEKLQQVYRSLLEKEKDEKVLMYLN